MEFQLTIQALWEDDGMLTVDSHAASWGFVGRTQVYTTYQALEKWAKELAALSLVAGQTVEFQAGERNSYAYLGVTIAVVDSVGHCVCRVAFESNANHTWECKNKLEVEIRIEPNAMDRFIVELMTIVDAKNLGEACLSGVEN